MPSAQQKWRSRSCAISLTTNPLLLRLGAGGLDLGRGVELLEVLREARRKIGGCLVIGVLVLPRIPRRQDFRWNSRTRLRDAEAERRLDFELNIGQTAIDQRVDHGARIRQAHALADAVSATLPAG